MMERWPLGADVSARFGGGERWRMKLLELVYPIFLDGLSTVNRSCVRHKNRVLLEKRGQGSGIVLVECLVIFFYKGDKRLA